MSYHITIVRTNGENQKLISKDEILNFVNSNNHYSYEDRENYLNIKRCNDSGKDYYFIYQNGEIWIKNPEADHIDYLIEMANSFGGRARGDGLETYNSSDDTYFHSDDTYFHSDDEPLIKQAEKLSKATKANRKKKQLLVNGTIFFVFIFLAVLVSLFGE